MAHHLPPLDDEQNDGETAPTDWQKTRPNPPVAPPPHVQPRNRTTELGPRPPIAKPPYPAVPPNRRPNRKQDSGLYLPLWSLVMMLVAVLIAAFAVVFAIISLGGGLPLSSTPIIRIITAIPSATPAFVQSVIATPTLPPVAQAIVQSPPPVVLQGPTLEAIVLSPTPEQITTGKRVVVYDVGETQLNVRDLPGTTNTIVLFRASDGEIFVVVDGPQQANGFVWWKIADPLNPNRLGWAAENYLRVVSN